MRLLTIGLVSFLAAGCEPIGPCYDSMRAGETFIAGDITRVSGLTTDASSPLITASLRTALDFGAVGGSALVECTVTPLLESSGRLQFTLSGPIEGNGEICNYSSMHVLGIQGEDEFSAPMLFDNFDEPTLLLETKVGFLEQPADGSCTGKVRVIVLGEGDPKGEWPKSSSITGKVLLQLLPNAPGALCPTGCWLEYDATLTRP